MASKEATSVAEKEAPAKEKVYFFDPFVVKTKPHLDQAWTPTPHGIELGKGMVSVPHAFVGKCLIEIGVGSGLHSVLALKLGARRVDVTDIDEGTLHEAMETASLNEVAFHNTWIKDWFDFDPLSIYDMVLCNPPFAKAQPGDRRWYIREMIRKSGNFLRPGGHLLFSQSSMADFVQTEVELTACGFAFTVVHSSRGPFREYYYTEPAFLEEAKKVNHGFEVICGVHIETLRVYLCTKK